MGWRGDWRKKDKKLIERSQMDEITTVQMVELITLPENTLVWNQSWLDSAMVNGVPYKLSAMLVNVIVI